MGGRAGDVRKVVWPEAAGQIVVRRGEPDLGLDSQAMVDRCHLLGRYRMLNYAKPPGDEISEGDLEWAGGIAAEAGYLEVA